MMLRLVGLLAVAAQVALALPSCEAEVEANCLGEDADMSPEGITACLGALAELSADCKTYLAMMTACEADLAPDAICGAAKMDGEAMPCLLQRTKPEDLTEACRAALPVEEKRGLAKFWADGKRRKERRTEQDNGPPRCLTAAQLAPYCHARLAQRTRSPHSRALESVSSSQEKRVPSVRARSRPGRALDQ